MNAKNLLIFMIILTVCLSACAPAMKPTIIAEAPREESQSEGIIKTVEVQVAAEPAVEEPVIVEKEIEVEKQPLSSIPKAPMPESNFFQDYGVNPFEDPLEDHLSTFALDVDTASYTVARRYVTDGNIPPSDSVRVEEFINYFNQGYSNPADIAFGIYADAAPSPFHYDGTYLLRIGIQGYAIAEEDRKPVSLTFVIDTSGSMKKENRLELVKQSLEMLVDRLRPTDTVSIVSYGSEARVILSPTSGEDRQMIMATIYSLYTSGSTNAEAGLTLGYDMANRAYRRDATNRVILCSDGVANVGNTGPDAILNSIGEYALQGIYLTSVGFGMGNFNDVLMEQLADRGNGNYAYVDNLDEAEKLFVDDLTSTLQVIALDAKVQVDFNPEVVSRYRLIGYENRAVADQDFRDDSVDAGELGAGHSATALYAVQLHPEASGRIATVQLRWQNPETGQVQEINGNFNTWDLEQDFYASDPYYQLAVVVAQYAEILRSSPWARESSIDRVLEHAFRIAGLLPQESEVSEFAALVSRASQIKELSRR